MLVKEKVFCRNFMSQWEKKEEEKGIFVWSDEG